MSYKLSENLKYTWKHRKYPRKINLENRFCTVPNNNVNIDNDGKCFHCICDGWMPFPSGVITDFATLDDVYTNPIARKLQDSTSLGGSFKFCSVANCGILQNSKYSHNNKKCLHIGIDNSCNLRCPSCRECFIFYKTGSAYEKKKTQFNHLVNLINNYTDPLEIILGADGDPFASILYKDFMYKLNESKTRELIIKTNGLLIEKRLMTYPAFNQIKTLQISMDAATSDVYSIVRPPGDFNSLIKNLDFLSTNFDMPLEFYFVIQKNNLKDVYPFIELCKHYNAKPCFTLLEDWGTWHNFYEHDLTDQQNDLHSEWLAVSRDLQKQGYLSE